MKHRKKVYITVLSFMLILLFSAFGCKTNEGDPVADNANTEPDTKVTFNIPDTNDSSTSSTGVSDLPTDQSGTDNVNVTYGNENVDAKTESQTNPIVSDTKSEEILLAEKIVEIFGSFTNKSREPFKNVTDIEAYATTQLHPFLNTLKQNTIDPEAPFYGITTKALSTAVLASSANSTELLITTEREEITEQSQIGTKTFALIKVDMVKENDEWKVNGLFWQ